MRSSVLDTMDKLLALFEQGTNLSSNALMCFVLANKINTSNFCSNASEQIVLSNCKLL